MLFIKPTQSLSKEPDSAHATYEPTQVLFVQDQDDEPEPPQEQQKQDFKMATRVQGGTTTIETSENSVQKPAEQDVPAPALSDEYKKGMHNQTTSEEQSEDGDINISQEALLAPEEQPEKQVLPEAPEQVEILSATNEEPSSDDINSAMPASTPPLEKNEESSHTHASPGELLKAVITEKMARVQQEDVSTQTPTIKQKIEEKLQLLPEKLVSKKHRPAEVGQENLSKIQLSKIIEQDKPTIKKKLSLQDLQQGFTQFIRNNQTQQTDGSYSTIAAPGNSAYFSSIGNATTDDAEGLRMASYMRQVGQMYHSAHASYPQYENLHKQVPTDNSVVLVTIERSGKISSCEIITSCGITSLDTYHVKVIESIGSFPPIPKYIPDPLKVPATLAFRATSRTNFVPVVRKK